MSHLRIETGYRVNVTRDGGPVHTGTRWALFANYPNRIEAREAAMRAIGLGYAHAELVTTERFSLVPGTRPTLMEQFGPDADEVAK